MNKSHPKLVARGSEAEEAGLKFKGAPADDCDPFAIQNYIDRLAAEVYDSIFPPRDNQQDKDEWELMKQKAKSVPFQDVTLSIALKHGLLDEVKKENANKSFEKDNILTIMKVRDEFLHDYTDAHSFEYQWQIWVEWERYLKQIGITIPQWGKIARKLIRLGVQLIQDDMTKKYTQISSGSTNKRKQEPEEGTERRRRVTLPSDTPAPFAGSPGFGSYAPPSMHRSSSFGGYIDAPFSTATMAAYASNASTPFSSAPSTPFSSAPSTPIYSAPSTPNTPSEAPFSPMQSPVTTAPSFRNFENSPQVAQPFGASLYNMIHSAPSTSTNIFATTPPMRSPSLTSAPSPSHAPRPMDTTPTQAAFTNYSTPFSNAASLPYPIDLQPGYVHSPGHINSPPGHTPTQTHTFVPGIIPHSPSISSYPMPMQMQYPTQATPPFSTTPPTYMVTSPSAPSPSLTSPSPNFATISGISSSPAFTTIPPQFMHNTLL